MTQVRRRGFTLIEILVVLGIISVLLSVLYVSFDSSRRSARDSERQVELTKLQLAIETYKSQNGQFPAAGCGSAGEWVGNGPSTAADFVNCNSSSGWIVGMVPEYIAELPADSRFETTANRGFMYRTNADRSAYKILAHNTAEGKFITQYDQKFARCPYTCAANPACADATAIDVSQQNTYALYSRGAECW